MMTTSALSLVDSQTSHPDASGSGRLACRFEGKGAREGSKARLLDPLALAPAWDGSHIFENTKAAVDPSCTHQLGFSGPMIVQAQM